MHRYDAGNTAHNPDTHGPKNEPEVKWVFNFGKGGSITPSVKLTQIVVAEGMVFFGIGIDVYAMYAFSSVEGHPVWEWPPLNTHNREAKDPPAYHDGSLYAVDGLQGHLTKFDAEDGELVWEEGIGAHQEPIYADGSVYVHGDKGVYSLSTEGETEWTADFGGSRPLAYNDGRLVVADSDETVVLDADDGTELWSKNFESEDPVAKDGLVYLADDDTYAFDLEDGAEVWRHDDGNEATVLTENEAYLGDAVVDAETGEELWRVDEVDAVGINHPAGLRFDTVADGVWYFTTGDNLTAVDVESREVIWTLDIEDINGQIVVADGYIYAIDPDRVYRIGEA
jgi:outer membrane protein assembly factor BamB